MRTGLYFATLVTIVSLAPGCGATTTGTILGAETSISATDAVLADFRARVAKYVALRTEVVQEVGAPELTDDPAVIWTREQTLARRLRERRTDARHGDLLTPEVRVVFRRLLRAELQSDAGPDIRFKLQDDAPAAGSIALSVNARYPAGLPFPTTPAPLLLALPPLPRTIEYRIVGKDLLLIDQPADLILDYMRNAIG
jgi:hypothetical protein